MILLVVCCISSLVFGIIIQKKIGLAFYRTKFRKLQKICDDYKNFNQQLIDEIDYLQSRR
jgi:hypothetical protein